MGGYGSGGWNATGRLTTADVPYLSINILKKEGVLQEDFSGNLRWNANEHLIMANVSFCSNSNVLSIANSETGRTKEISVTWEICPFGGQRPFFCCPGCSQRVLKIFYVERFQCRRCHGLSYPSQREREGESDRAQRRADKIRVRMDGEPGWLNMPTN